MKKLTIYVILATLCINFGASGQNKNPNIQPLKIGNKVPEELLNIPLQVINHPTGKKTITLNDYKGKLIILDFWATWCTSCIAAMPKAHELQKHFKDSLIIIASTYEPKEKVSKFISENKNLKSLNTFSIVGDSILKGYFPHRLIPHYIWISQDGILKATTSSDELTINNINKILQKASPVIAFKKDMNIDKPLFINDELQTDKILSYSIMTRGRQIGLPGGTQTRQNGNVTNRRIFTNCSVLTMYTITAFELFRGMGENYTPNRLILEVERSEDIHFNKMISKKDLWEKQHSYNYDVMVPADEATKLYPEILNGLNRNLPYYGRIEKRKTKCFELIIKDSKRTIPSSDSKNSFPLEIFSGTLNSKSFIKLPVINNTGIKDKVKLQLSVSKNMESLTLELQQFNLELKPIELEVNMMIISDKKNPFPHH